MYYILLIIGFILLIKGADYFVTGSSNLAKSLKVSSLIIGLTIVSFGTSAPETVVSTLASIKGSNDISISNVIGSNIFNICLLPGIGGIISPINYDNGFNISLLFLAVVIIEIIIIQKLEKKYVIERKKGIALSLIYLLYTIKLVLT